MSLFGAPLLLIPFAIYNIVTFLMPGVSWSAPLVNVQMMSGTEWVMSLGDILVAFAILVLLAEIVKFARVGVRSWIDHGLAILLLGGMTAEFVMLKGFATATFFQLLVLSFVDAFGGVAASVRGRARRREILIDREAALVPAAEPHHPPPQPVEEKREPIPGPPGTA